MLTKSTAAACVVAALAFAAPAFSATVLTSGPSGVGPVNAPVPPQSFDAGDPVSFTSFIDSGEGTVEFTFTANQDAFVTDFALTGVGLVSDFPLVSFALDNGAGGDTMFTVIPGGSTGFGGASLDDFSMTAGETVTLTFTELSTLTGSLQIGATFETSAVPLPAGILTLGVALGGLVLVRRRQA